MLPIIHPNQGIYARMEYGLHPVNSLLQITTYLLKRTHALPQIRPHKYTQTMPTT